MTEKKIRCYVNAVYPTSEKHVSLYLDVLGDFDSRDIKTGFIEVKYET